MKKADTLGVLLEGLAIELQKESFQLMELNISYQLITDPTPSTEAYVGLTRYRYI